MNCKITKNCLAELLITTNTNHSHLQLLHGAPHPKLQKSTTIATAVVGTEHPRVVRPLVELRHRHPLHNTIIGTWYRTPQSDPPDLLLNCGMNFSTLDQLPPPKDRVAGGLCQRTEIRGLTRYLVSVIDVVWLKS